MDIKILSEIPVCFTSRVQLSHYRTMISQVLEFIHNCVVSMIVHHLLCLWTDLINSERRLQVIIKRE